MIDCNSIGKPAPVRIRPPAKLDEIPRLSCLVSKTNQRYHKHGNKIDLNAAIED